MSAICEWNGILDHAIRIKLLVADKDWVAISELTDDLDKRLRHFFENQISHLSVDEKISVKKQGAELLALIAQVQQQLALARKEASQQAGRMAKGRKGISAYKKA